MLGGWGLTTLCSMIAWHFIYIINGAFFLSLQTLLHLWAYCILIQKKNETYTLVKMTQIWLLCMWGLNKHWVMMKMQELDMTWDARSWYLPCCPPPLQFYPHAHPKWVPGSWLETWTGQWCPGLEHPSWYLHWLLRCLFSPLALFRYLNHIFLKKCNYFYVCQGLLALPICGCNFRWKEPSFQL